MPNVLSRRLVLTLAPALAAWSLSLAAARSWPARPVIMVVPFPAGGSTDVLARALAQELSDKLGQQFLVENRAGAGGNIGAAVVARAAPDGYAILFGTPGPVATNKLMYKSLPFDAEKDFIPIVLIAKSPLIVLANPATPAKTLAELTAYAKANPNKINAGHPGNGTLGHVSSVLMQKELGISMTDVPYRGTAPLTIDLLGGRLDVAVDIMSTYVPLVKQGKLRALAVTGAARTVELPDVITVQEAGVAGFEATAWYALVAPTGTPAEVVGKINAVTNDFLRSAKGRGVLQQLGMQAAGGTPADLKTFVTSEIAKWGPVVKAANISL